MEIQAYMVKSHAYSCEIMSYNLTNIGCVYIIMAHLKSRVQNEIDFFNKSKVSIENKTIKSTHFRDGKIMHLIGYITNVCLI